MEERLFTFLGEIGGHSQAWMVMSHLILTAVIVLIIARLAVRKIQLVPTGTQNV